MRTVVLDRSRSLVGLAATIALALATNVAIGIGAAVGSRALVLAAAVALLPVFLLAFGSLIESHRAMLAWSALALNFTGLPYFSTPLPLSGSIRVFLADVLVLLALGSWISSRLSRVQERNPVRLSSVFRLPLLALIVTVGIGIVVGNVRYGTSVVGEPLRILLYAAIALALTDLEPRSAWRAVTTVFYAGAIVQALWAIYYLATGGSQTKSDVLSTGGVRVLALSVAIYLTGSLVCALLNLERETRPGRQLLHAGVGGLALFGIIVSFGRTTYAAMALIIPVLLAARRYLRRTVFWLVPLALPPFIAALLLISSVAPTLLPTIEARLLGTSSSDSAVEWRVRAIEASLEGVEHDLLTGVGFGRENRFVANNELVSFRGDPENSYVWILAGGGLLALGALLTLSVTFAVDCVRRIRHSVGHAQALVIWSLTTWIAFMINALTGPILADPEMLLTIWVLMALPSCVSGKAVPSAP